MIALRSQENYVPGLPKYFASFPHKEFAHQKDTRVPLQIIVIMGMMIMWVLI